MARDREKRAVLSRLRRIEGQIRGLQKMVEQGIPCQDVLTQVAAVMAAVKKVGAAIVQNYMQECLAKAKKEPAGKQVKIFEDFQKAMTRYIDWS